MLNKNDNFANLFYVRQMLDAVELKMYQPMQTRKGNVETHWFICMCGPGRARRQSQLHYNYLKNEFDFWMVHRIMNTRRASR